MKISSLKILIIIKTIYIYSKGTEFGRTCAQVVQTFSDELVCGAQVAHYMDKLDFSSCFSFAIIEHFVLFNWKEFSPVALWFKQCSLSNWNISCLRALQEGDFNEFHAKLKDSKQVLVMNLPMLLLLMIFFFDQVLVPFVVLTFI